MKAVKSNLLKLARVPLDIGGQFPSWSFEGIHLSFIGYKVNRSQMTKQKYDFK